MPRRLPPLYALRAFEAAARHCSFTRAAEELSITQSAVSRQIQALEDEVGVSLFLRHTRAVELTSAGAQLLRAVLPPALASMGMWWPRIGQAPAKADSSLSRGR